LQESLAEASNGSGNPATEVLELRSVFLRRRFHVGRPQLPGRVGLLTDQGPFLDLFGGRGNLQGAFLQLVAQTGGAIDDRIGQHECRHQHRSQAEQDEYAARQPSAPADQGLQFHEDRKQRHSNDDAPEHRHEERRDDLTAPEHDQSDESEPNRNINDLRHDRIVAGGCIVAIHALTLSVGDWSRFRPVFISKLGAQNRPRGSICPHLFATLRIPRWPRKARDQGQGREDGRNDGRDDGRNESQWTEAAICRLGGIHEARLN